MISRPSTSVSDDNAVATEWIDVAQLITNNDMPMMKASSSDLTRSDLRPSDGQTAQAISAVKARKNRSPMDTCATSPPWTSTT